MNKGFVLTVLSNGLDLRGAEDGFITSEGTAEGLEGQLLDLVESLKYWLSF